VNYVLMSLGQFCEKTSGEGNLTRMKMSMTALFSKYNRGDINGDIFWNWLVAVRDLKGVLLINLLRTGASIYLILDAIETEYQLKVNAKEFLDAFNVIAHISKPEDTSKSLVDNSMFKGESSAEGIVSATTFDRMNQMLAFLAKNQIKLILVSHTNTYNYDYIREQLQDTPIFGENIIVAPSFEYPTGDLNQVGDHSRIAQRALEKLQFSPSEDHVISCLQTILPTHCEYVSAYALLLQRYTFDDFKMAVLEHFPQTLPTAHK